MFDKIKTIKRAASAALFLVPVAAQASPENAAILHQAQGLDAPFPGYLPETDPARSIYDVETALSHGAVPRWFARVAGTELLMAYAQPGTRQIWSIEGWSIGAVARPNADGSMRVCLVLETPFRADLAPLLVNMPNPVTVHTIQPLVPPASATPVVPAVPPAASAVPAGPKMSL